MPRRKLHVPGAPQAGTGGLTHGKAKTEARKRRTALRRNQVLVMSAPWRGLRHGLLAARARLPGKRGPAHLTLSSGQEGACI